MTEYRSGTVTFVEGHGSLTLWLSMRQPCDNHGHHSMQKRVEMDVVEPVSDPFEWLEAVFAAAYDEACPCDWQVDPAEACSPFQEVSADEGH